MMNDNAGIARQYQSSINEFQQFVDVLDDSHPCVVNFCFQEIMQFMHDHKSAGDSTYQLIKTETVKQRKALESVLDIMQWHDKYLPSIKVVETGIAKLNAIADLFPVEVLTRKDLAATDRIYSLPDADILS